MNVMEFGSPQAEPILLLHGGGLSWWNYASAARLLEQRYHVILPILDGHTGSDAPFRSIEETAARLLSEIDRRFGGTVLALGGLSLGGQIAAEMLSQRPGCCRCALLESTLAKPMPLTRLLIAPVFGMSYGLISQRWFARLQAAYSGIPDDLFDAYYRDTCGIQKADMIAFLQSSSGYSPKPARSDTDAAVHIVYGSKERGAVCASAALLRDRIAGSTVEILPGLRHGELSLRRPEQYAACLEALISRAQAT